MVIADALAAGATHADAAARAGVSEMTVSRRVADPRFRNQVAELRAVMLARAAARLSDAMTDADGTALQSGTVSHPDLGVGQSGAAHLPVLSGSRDKVTRVEIHR